jgi:hypothetical protein
MLGARPASIGAALDISHTRVSSDRLQLSCFKLGGRILLVSHFKQADLELAQKHNRLSSSSAVLGIRR